LDDHLRQRTEGDFEGDLKENYAPDVVLLTCTGIHRGRSGLRECHKVLCESVGDTKVEIVNKLVQGEFAFLEWRAKSDSVEVREGVDCFVIRDGKIVYKGIHFKVHPLNGHGSS
jgi:hypothetical protein